MLQDLHLAWLGLEQFSIVGVRQPGSDGRLDSSISIGEKCPETRYD